MREAPEGAKPRSLESMWKDVLEAHQGVVDANEELRRAMTRLDVALDQKIEPDD
jgi:uncharacterized protein YaaN involved in tellurite resistance